MAWTTPLTRAIGYLVTKASDWDPFIVDNMKYLKGLAGPVTIEDQLRGISGYVYHPGVIRQVRIGWEPIWAYYDLTDQRITQLDYSVQSGSGAHDDGGTGQHVIQVANDGAGYQVVANRTEDYNGFDTSFNCSRNPYFRMEFALDVIPANMHCFLGFRATKTATVLPPNTENHFGLSWGGATWNTSHANGTTLVNSTNLTIAAARRHVVEAYLISAASLVCYVDGVLVQTSAANLPTGDMEFVFFLKSLGTGPATVTHLTLGEAIFQEKLA